MAIIQRFFLAVTVLSLSFSSLALPAAAQEAPNDNGVKVLEFVSRNQESKSPSLFQKIKNFFTFPPQKKGGPIIVSLESDQPLDDLLSKISFEISAKDLEALLKGAQYNVPGIYVATKAESAEAVIKVFIDLLNGIRLEGKVARIVEKDKGTYQLALAFADGDKDYSLKGSYTVDMSMQNSEKVGFVRGEDSAVNTFDLYTFRIAIAKAGLPESVIMAWEKYIVALEKLINLPPSQQIARIDELSKQANAEQQVEGDGRALIKRTLKLLTNLLENNGKLTLWVKGGQAPKPFSNSKILMRFLPEKHSKPLFQKLKNLENLTFAKQLRNLKEIVELIANSSILSRFEKLVLIKSLIVAGYVSEGNSDEISCSVGDRVEKTSTNKCNRNNGVVASNTCLSPAPQANLLKLNPIAPALAQTFDPDNSNTWPRRKAANDCERAVQASCLRTTIPTRAYVKDKYDCDNFAHDMYDYFSASIVSGALPLGTIPSLTWSEYHAWTDITCPDGHTFYLEPQNCSIYSRVPSGIKSLTDSKKVKEKAALFDAIEQGFWSGVGEILF